MSTTTLLDPALAMLAVSQPCRAHYRWAGVDCERSAAWSVAVVCDLCGPRRTYLCDACRSIVDVRPEGNYCRSDDTEIEIIAMHRLS